MGQQGVILPRFTVENAETEALLKEMGISIFKTERLCHSARLPEGWSLSRRTPVSKWTTVYDSDKQEQLHIFSNGQLLINSDCVYFLTVADAPAE